MAQTALEVSYFRNFRFFLQYLLPGFFNIFFILVIFSKFRGLSKIRGILRDWDTSFLAKIPWD